MLGCWAQDAKKAPAKKDKGAKAEGGKKGKKGKKKKAKKPKVTTLWGQSFTSGLPPRYGARNCPLTAGKKGKGKGKKK